MQKRLVKLDAKNGWRFSEVDPIRVARVTAELKRYVEAAIPVDNDPYGIRAQVLPLCDRILRGAEVLPMPVDALPLKYPFREHLVPESFRQPWAAFTVAVTGEHLEPPEEVKIDGVLYAYMEFEDPGDWPLVVQARAAERRQKLLSEPD